MGLIEKLIEQNEYNAELAEAANNQYEVAFYCEDRMDNPFLSAYKQRVCDIYNGDKTKIDRFFKAFVGCKADSIELCDTIFSKLSKIWDSRDLVRTYNFVDDTVKGGAIAYLDIFKKFWVKNSYTKMKTGFNSVLVVDLPVNQSSQLPEPYMYFVDVSTVEYLSLKNRETIEIIFSNKLEDSTIYHYYTDKFYSVWEKKSGSSDAIELSNFTHNLGYCPADFFWDDSLNSESQILKKNVLLSNTEDLFWYTYKRAESLKADLLYLNPTKQMPQSSCGYEKGNNVKCFGGKLVDDNKQPIYEGGYLNYCPICGNSQHNSDGAGNNIAINMDTPAVADGHINLKDPLIHYISPKIDGVKEQYIRIEQLKDDIVQSAAGSESFQTTEAINEKQVIANFEDRESVLTQLSLTYSDIIQWAEKTMLTLRYGSKFSSNSFFLGSKFFIHSVDDLMKLRNNRTNPIEKSDIDIQIIETKYRHNEKQKTRELLMYKLLPEASLSDSEFLEYVKINKISDLQIQIRNNFVNIIELFESKYGDITVFKDDFFNENVLEIDRMKVIKNLIRELVDPIEIETEEIE